MTNAATPTSTTRAAGIATVARGGVANLIGALVSAVANFALTLVVAHFVTPVAAGVFFSVTSLFLILEMVGRAGADTGLIYFIARWRALGESSRIRAGVLVALAPIIATCLLVALALCVFAPQFARLIGDSHETSVGLLRVVAVVLPVAVAYDVALGATRGFGWMRPTVLVERIGRPLVQLVCVAGVLVAGWDGGLGAAWAMPYVAGLFAVVWFVHRRMSPLGRLRAGDARIGLRPVFKQFWAFSLPRAFAGVAQIVLQRLDIVLVAAIRGPRDAAIYTAATRFLVVGQFINQAISAPVQPRMSAALSAGDVDGARDLYRVSTTWLVLASWPFFGIATVLAPLYLSLFGHAYRGATTVVVILGLSMFVASGVGLVDTVIIMAGRTAWNLATTLLSLAVNVGVDLALIPHFGVTGAAVGWCAAIVTANIVPLLLAWRGLGLHPFGRSVSAAYLLCGACFLVVPFGAYALSGGSNQAAAVGSAVGIGGYLWGLRRGHNLFELTGILAGSRTGTRRPGLA